MLELSRICFLAAGALVILAFGAQIVVLFGTRRTAGSEVAARVGQPVGAVQPVGAGAGDSSDPGPSGAYVETSYEPPEPRAGRPTGWASYSVRLAQVALALLTVGLVARMLVTGHAPFANHYEYAVSFAWGILLFHTVFEHRYHVRIIGVVVLPVVFGLLLYASVTGAEVQPLPPALQNHLLLTLHVVTAVIAYGAAAISFAAAALYLLRHHTGWRLLPGAGLLDEIGYKAQVICFPMLTLMLILGAVWGNIAWGRYWAWDPKETSALVTWLVYGAYLHARVARGWQGTRSAWLLVIGFAAVVFTFFSSLFLGGLHSYA